MDDLIGGTISVILAIVLAYYIWKYGVNGTAEKIQDELDALIRRIMYGPEEKPLPPKWNESCKHKTEPIVTAAGEHIGHMCTFCFEVFDKPRRNGLPIPPKGSGGGSHHVIKTCRHPNVVVDKRIDGSSDLFCPDCGTSGWVPFKSHPLLGDVQLPDTGRSEYR